MQATRAAARAERDLLRRIAVLDAPVESRLRMALELWTITEPLLGGLFRRARRNALDGLMR